MMSDHLSDNLERASRAGGSILWAQYSDNGNPVTDLYDLICDLLHYADTLEDVEVPGYDLGRADSRGVTQGQYVADMALWHYHAELAEEAEAKETQA